MGAQTRIFLKIRALIEDLIQTRDQTDTYVSSSIFTLIEDNVSAVNSVEINGIESGVTYTYNSTTNKVTITSSLSSGDIIVINYSYNQQYSDNELEDYIEGALAYISNSNIGVFIQEQSANEFYPIPTLKQENLIAMITATLLKPNISRYTLGGETIHYPETKSKENKIKDIIFDYKNDTHGIFQVL